ncbi:hypothetical protein BJY01DRAFT_244625 [Aspergillus pseudoustus]|uniref:Uncharacterized protein n=1 Tax=Aspergillus pseudoustus TaxID=1810923 RepID=A0ABR4KJL2_9EURO
MTDPEYRLFQNLPSANSQATSTRSDAGQAGDNDADIYNYDNIPTETSTTNRTVRPQETDLGDSGMFMETTEFDNGEGSTIYDPESGAYDQVYDYRTGEGGYKHHRERLTEDGVYQVRDVLKRPDGSRQVHREYENPVTGTSTVRDYER